MAIKALSCPIPENINPLSPNGFMFSVQKLPELTFFCQEVILPSPTLPDFDQYSPFTRIAIPGSTLEYEPLRVQFMIDHDMKNYKAIYNWLTGLGFPETHSQFSNFIENDMKNVNQNTFSDATLTILGNSNSPVATIRFIDCFPVSLDSLTFTSVSSDVQYLIGNASFRYTLYKFI